MTCVCTNKTNKAAPLHGRNRERNEVSNALITLTRKAAQKYDMGDSGEELVSVLKATAFKGPASDAQLTALMIVANQYGLNPFTKEIFAFPDKNNGIVPVVGVDGWSRIINEHPQFDGIDFEQDDESCTCIMYRKDRSHPIKVTEYLSECKRPTGPWQSHPKRMLRHKSMIQCARLAFGYVGIYDQDEAERLAEVEINPINKRQTGAQVAEAARQQAAVEYDAEDRAKLLATLEAVATEYGVSAYAEEWSKLTKAQRKAIGPDEHERLKKIADSIQAETVETIDGETGEVIDHE